MRRVRGEVAALVAGGLFVGVTAGGFIAFNSNGAAETVREVSPQSVSTGTPLEATDYRWGRIEVYPVIGDGTLYPVPPELPGDMWAAFMRMATPQYTSEHMVALRVAYAPSSPVVASVERTSSDPAGWALTVNLATETNRDEYLRTLIHEYAHLLMLGEVEFGDAAGLCETTLLQEGCLLPSSTLHRFAERFWSHYGAEAPVADSASSSDGWRMYVQHTADFVTTYAATNFVEDAAESFTEFVLRDRPQTDTTWAQKLEFFWSDQHFVEIRAHILEWFGDDLPEPPPPSRR